jgi:predicted GNAT family N-acyltransferase
MLLLAGGSFFRVIGIKKWGHELMREAIAAIAKYYNEDKITIGAQLYQKNSMKAMVLCKAVRCT